MGRKAKKVTLEELQAYINGAIELNEDGWHPDKAQWEKLVSMIMNVTPSVVTVVNNQPNINQHPTRRSETIEYDTSLGGESANHLTEMASNAPRTDMRRQQVESGGSQSVDPESGAISSGMKIKTANRDDSKGIGPSTFE